jgi:hypothetical protein
MVVVVAVRAQTVMNALRVRVVLAKAVVLVVVVVVPAALLR